MNIAIIGAGLIGGKRAAALGDFPEDRVTVVCDTDVERAKALAETQGCDWVADWKDAVARDDVDIVVNAAINAVLEPITVAALEAGKHVLCEKPLGRNAEESASMVAAAEKHGRILKTGFNHRYHPGLMKAHDILSQGGIGNVFAIRARYGHGSRPGMENEWRSSKELCGGGELLDQGVHILDLMRWFAGPMREVYAKVETKVWNIDVEDNAFAILTAESGVTCQFHVSWTNWRNVFSFEIFGDGGYLSVSGLGGSYGPETLEYGRRKPEGGRPDIDTFEFPSEDISWKEEWKDFRTAIEEQRRPLADGRDGLMANRLVAALYESSRNNAPAAISESGTVS